MNELARPLDHGLELLCQHTYREWLGEELRDAGGVEVTADFTGTNGYDAYVSADAVGNSVTGYVCSTCQGNLIATNAQTNSGPVSATATTTVRGTGRAIASSASAVGNTATFYASRPGS
jgi:hypothetical protein